MMNTSTRFFVFFLVILLHALLLGALIQNHQPITPPQADVSEASISGNLVSPSPAGQRTPNTASEAKPTPKQTAHTSKPNTTSSNQASALPKPDKQTPQEPSQEATHASVPTPSKEASAPPSGSNPAASAPNTTTNTDANKSKSEEATITPPRTDAAHLNNPPPIYPAISRRLGEQGKVLLDVHILPNGSVEQLKIRTSSGYPRLDEAALNAVKQWKYVPAKRGDQAIAFWYIQPISFVLNSN